MQTIGIGGLMNRLITFLIMLFFTQNVNAAKGINEDIKLHMPELNNLYEDLHEHPELGYQEKRTSALLANKMRNLGFNVTEKVGKTGLVAVYKNGSGPTVMVRTELDALPLEEKTGLPFTSKVTTKLDGKSTYVSHSCGHDIHMAAWFGSAKILLQNKNKWHGTLVFIAQPSEEITSGALAMLNDGLYTRFPKPDYIFGAHVMNQEIGSFDAEKGYASSSIDNYAIKFIGKGGHGSSPNKAIDPILIGADYVNSIQSIVSREMDPNEFGVITIGSFQSGYAPNIIPEQSELKLALRSRKPEIRQFINKRVSEKADVIAVSHLAPKPEVKHLSGAAAVYNDEAVTKAVSEAITQNTDLKLQRYEKLTGSDDFSEYTIGGVKGVYFLFGGYSKEHLDAIKAKGETVPYNHSPKFAPDYKLAIPSSIKLIVTSVLTVSKTDKI